MSGLMDKLDFVARFEMGAEVKSYDWNCLLRDVRVVVLLYGTGYSVDPSTASPVTGSASISFRIYDAEGDPEITDLSTSTKPVVAIVGIGEKYGVTTGITIDLSGVTNLERAVVEIWAR